LVSIATFGSLCPMAEVLEVEDISKSFPGVRALHQVSFSLQKGEVVAVLGENGAGKSTLMKILAGVQRPDGGTIRLDGARKEIRSVAEGLSLGIALIHQELTLAPNLSIAANLFLGREPRTFGLIHEREIEVVKELRERGISILYISHRLSEVIELADRVIVLRDGENVGTLEREEITYERMVGLMVGRDLAPFSAYAPQVPGAAVLTVRGLRTPAHPVHEIDFEICAGEIVGLAGLVGAGRTELLAALFGVTPAVHGRIAVNGEILPIRNPTTAIAAGIALVPEDRKQQGLLLDMAVAENLSLALISQEQRLGFIHFDAEQRLSTEMMEKTNIKTPSSRQIVRYLSGGNQQKVVIGKWLATKPTILLLDEPTRGIDVVAKQEIYALMEGLAAAGVAILFASSEMEEVIGLSDRVLVMHEGRLSGELSREELSEEAIMTLATGRSKSAA
jgi:ribose transport system ATP-binding protein